MNLTSPTPDEDIRRLAERRVRARHGLMVHAVVYLAVNLGLVALNLATSPHYLWFIWSVFGWGIGLAAHAWAVLGSMTDAHERAVQAEMARLRDRGR